MSRSANHGIAGSGAVLAIANGARIVARSELTSWNGARRDVPDRAREMAHSRTTYWYGAGLP